MADEERDDDTIFSDIVAREFHTTWTPPAETQAELQPLPPPSPLVVPFQLNLYDDEESYREVSPETWTMPKPTMLAVAALALGVLILIGAFVFNPVPRFLAALGVVLTIAGAVVLVIPVLRRPPHSPDDEDSAIV